MLVALAFTTMSLASAGASSPGDALLDICRSAYESFEPTAAVKSCAAAAAVQELSVAHRIDAYRLLAQAHLLANEDAQAALAFSRMLVLDDDLLLPKDAGPREREVFDRARAKIEREGRIGAEHTVDDSGALRVTVTDPMKRVNAARVRARSRTGDRIHVEPLDVSRTGDVVVMTGSVPRLAREAVVDFDIILVGHTGAALAVDAPLHGTLRTLTSSDGAPRAGMQPAEAIGYAVAASGIGLGVMTAAVGGAVASLNGYPVDTWLPIVGAGTVFYGAVAAVGVALIVTTPAPEP